MLYEKVRKYREENKLEIIAMLKAILILLFYFNNAHNDDTGIC